MSRKERDTSKKRKELIDAAVSIFEEIGYETATMEQIASRAGAVKKTLYNHFETKEKLLEVIIGKCVAIKHDIANFSYDSNKILRKQLIELIELRIKNYLDPQSIRSMRVLFNTHTRHKELFKRMYSGIGLQDEEILIRWITEAEKEGRLKVVDKEIAAYIFWSMVYGAFIWPQTLDDILTSEKIAKITCEIADTFLYRYTV
jgi:TetR/AcrR family transcriptional regulator of autoinduction and epiphytic fitness